MGATPLQCVSSAPGTEPLTAASLLEDLAGDDELQPRLLAAAAVSRTTNVEPAVRNDVARMDPPKS
jgi:hypothetical protein